MTPSLLVRRPSFAASLNEGWPRQRVLPAQEWQHAAPAVNAGVRP